ncbi:MAG: DUF222 domain-containing protein [Pseudonocardiaceae bacterium]|nr:DUF222 domain-containing protein [Pseudonocardiaceae bacterium]
MAQSRQVAYEQARLFAAMNEVIHCEPFAGESEVRRGQVPDEYCADEVRAALSWTRRAAGNETGLAFTLLRTLPLVHAALLAGHIDRSKACVFARHLGDLTPEQIEVMCREVLPRAGRWTTGQIAARLLQLIISVDPEYYERRYRKAVRDRQVCGYLDPDGTAAITAGGLAPEEATAALERVDALSRAVRQAGHPGTLEQVRADVFLGLLDGSLHGLARDEIITALLMKQAGAAPNGAGAATRAPGDDDSEDDNPTDDDPDDNTPDDGDPDDNTPDDGDPDDGDPDDGDPDDGDPDDGDPDDGDPDDGDPDDGDPDDHAPRGGGPGGGGVEDQRVGIEVRVALSTLLGRDEQPGEIPAWGFVPASSVRATVARQRRAEWRWAVVDADGYLISEGITRRRPSHLTRTGPRGGIVELHIPETLLTELVTHPTAGGRWAELVADVAEQHRRRNERARDLDSHPDDRFPRSALRRHTQVRDRTCVHPGCRAAARRCDQDHTLDHSRGGTTTADDLAPTCRHDHMLKTAGGWQLSQPEAGTFIWTSPLGRTYSTHPDPVLPPPIDTVARQPEEWFDDPPDDIDHPLVPHRRGRHPPPRPEHAPHADGDPTLRQPPAVDDEPPF